MSAPLHRDPKCLLTPEAHHQVMRIGKNGMNATYPTARSVRHAFAVLGRLPAEALIDLAERLIDCIDQIEPDADLEAEEDACGAGECGGIGMYLDGSPGDADDAEPEEDDDDTEDEPLSPGKLRPERDGFVRVWRRPIINPNQHRQAE